MDVKKEHFKVDFFEYVKRHNRLRVNLDFAFKLVLRKCTELTYIHLEVLPNWEAVDNRSYVINLLNMVKSLSNQNMDRKYHPLSIYMSKKSVYRLHQRKHMTNAKLVKILKVRVEVVKEIGRAVRVDANIFDDNLAAHLKDILMSLTDVKTVHKTEAQSSAWDQYLAVILLCVADRGRAGGQLLQNYALKGKLTFLETLAKAIAMINDYS